jgi:glucose-1-phosphate cytidylyltransferase
MCNRYWSFIRVTEDLLQSVRSNPLLVLARSSLEFAEKPQLDEWVSAGFFVFEPGVFNYLTSDDDCVLERDPLERLAGDGQLYAFQHDGFFYAMDTYREYQYLNQLWVEGKAPWKVW